MLSRTASNLYWMARYVERAENTARILDVTYRMSLLSQSSETHDRNGSRRSTLPARCIPSSGRYSTVTAKDVMTFMALDPDNPVSIFSCAKAARENARAVRGNVTSEMWEVLNSTWLELQHLTEDRLAGDGALTFFDWVKERSHLFRGVTVGTALKDGAFHFNRLGTFLERADNTTRILDVKYHVLLPKVEDVGGAVDYYQWAAVLRSVSAFESYRKVYRDVITPLRVAELLILRRTCRARCTPAWTSRTKSSRPLPRRTPARRCVARANCMPDCASGASTSIFSDGLHEYLTDFLARLQELGDEVNRSFFNVAYA